MTIQTEFCCIHGHPPERYQTASAPGAQRVVIGIPSVARAEILVETVQEIARQTRLPDLVLLSVADLKDTGRLERMNLPFPIQIVISAKGLTRQRNRILREVRENDLLLFLDDDFLMAPDYLEQMEQVFDANPDIVLTTGTLIADGILGPGLDHFSGSRLLAKGLAEPPSTELAAAHTGYGCNVAVRVAPILKNELFFDENLPLYSWLEDVDFSNRLKECGKFVRPGTMRGVHLGTKTGRTPGVYLGYSQIANPFYLIRKGTITRRRARDLMLRNLASNLRGTFFPKEWADSRGRLRGNLIAIIDLLLRRSAPDRILSLKP